MVWRTCRVRADSSFCIFFHLFLFFFIFFHSSFFIFFSFFHFSTISGRPAPGFPDSHICLCEPNNSAIGIAEWRSGSAPGSERKTGKAEVRFPLGGLCVFCVRFSAHIHFSPAIRLSLKPPKLGGQDHQMAWWQRAEIAMRSGKSAWFDPHSGHFFVFRFSVTRSFGRAICSSLQTQKHCSQERQMAWWWRVGFGARSGNWGWFDPKSGHFFVFRFSVTRPFRSRHLFLSATELPISVRSITEEAALKAS